MVIITGLSNGYKNRTVVVFLSNFLLKRGYGRFTTVTFIWSIIVKDIVVFLVLKVIISDIFFHCFLNKNLQVICKENTQTKTVTFRKEKHG